MRRGERHRGEEGAWHSLGGSDPQAPLAKVEPRIRVVAALLFALLTIRLDGLSPLALALLLGLWAVWLSGLPLQRIRRALLALDLFMLMILLTLPLVTPGEPLFELAGLQPSRDGTLLALQIAFKANAILLAVMALVGSMEAVALGHALHHLGLPDRLIHLFLLCVRYLSVVRREYLRLRLAMRARAFRPRSDLHTWRSYGYLWGMLLLRGLDRGERVLAAMRCRGFDGRFHRFHHAGVEARDWAFLLLWCGALLGIGVWDFVAT